MKRKVRILFGHDSLSFAREGVLRHTGQIECEEWPYTFARVYDAATSEFIGVAAERRMLAETDSDLILNLYF
jgi:hypothetical protein